MKKLIYIALLLGVISCNTQKNIVEKDKDSIKYESIDEEKLFKKIEKPETFSILKIKANASIEMGSSYPSVAVTLYMDYGKQIWANASLLLPLGRAQIVPSGFKMYERVGKTYVDADFDYVNDLLNVDFIDYKSLENLLTGKLFFPVNPKEYKFSIQNNNYVLVSEKPIKIGTGKDVRNLNSKISFDSNFNLKQVVLEDTINKSYLQVDYNNYIDFEGVFLPKSIKIFIKDKKETSISLDYNKFEAIKMDTPFEIPKGYSQRKIN